MASGLDVSGGSTAGGSAALAVRDDRATAATMTAPTPTIRRGAAELFFLAMVTFYRSLAAFGRRVKDGSSVEPSG
jgi:hypothetical protein